MLTYALVIIITSLATGVSVERQVPTKPLTHEICRELGTMLVKAMTLKAMKAGDRSASFAYRCDDQLWARG